MRTVFWALLLTGALWAVGCSSGDDGAECDTTGGQALAGAESASWPKFRHDNFNTGRADDAIDLANNTGVLRAQFPPAGEAPKGAFASSPAVYGPLGSGRVLIGSNDGQLYALDADDLTQDATFTANLLTELTEPPGPIVSSPAVDASGRIYVTTGDNLLLIVDSDGTILQSTATYSLGASSLALAADGTAYVGSTASPTAALSAICFNGVPRWTILGAQMEGSPALVPDGTLYVASSSSVQPYLRGVNSNDGRLLWSFSASALIHASPVLAVVDAAVETIYVADATGRLFAVNADGTRRMVLTDSGEVPFSFATGGPIIASPALDYPDGDGGVATVYVASTDGMVYAVDTTTALARAVFAAGGEIHSSPAVAHDGDRTTLIFGCDDGNVYRIVDEGDSFAEVWRYPVGSPIGRSSPAIGPDGTVYVGAEDGRVYAIGAPAS